MLIVYSEQGVNAQNYTNRLLEQVNRLNMDESKLPILRIMIESIDRIFDKTDIFALDEYLLFGKFNGILFNWTVIWMKSLVFLNRFMDCWLFVVLFAVGTRKMFAIDQ